MSNADQPAADEQNPRVLSPAKTPTRSSDAPSTNQDPAPAPQRDPRPFTPVLPIPVLSQPRKSSSAQAGRPSVFQRSLGALRMALPLMQKMLPLLEGNVATAVSNMMAPFPQGQAPDLTPLANALTKMHGELADLHNGVMEQGAQLKRVSDQVDLVKDAADRIALEQQEIVDDLHSLRKKVSVFAWVGLVLLIASIALNVVLLLRVERILP
jgi:hypothetical protein